MSDIDNTRHDPRNAPPCGRLPRLPRIDRNGRGNDTPNKGLHESNGANGKPSDNNVAREHDQAEIKVNKDGDIGQDTRYTEGHIDKLIVRGGREDGEQGTIST